ncbi:MAG: tRNA dihydrouridine(20/20a) synthase DusA [Gammaproteobacteria bacterium]|nr:tRNA dihydrouridine(20/20a) synthase DusA [Gammaproteobacteria bacterium]
MLDRTDRHFRYFLRLISPHLVLFTEMVTANTLKHGNRNHQLAYHPVEHPVVFQLGGSDPELLAQCAGLVEEHGYNEVNLNVGCPSDRVQKGRFGACLMKEPELVAECVSAMRDHVSIPVTVKNRLGVDDCDSYEALSRFIRIVSEAGCNTFYIHARKAWLKGLSPKQNRSIPPLMYDMVYQLAEDFPHLELIINGGITDVDQIKDHLKHVDGVMLGRLLCDHPFILHDIEQQLYSDSAVNQSRRDVLQRYLDYAEQQLGQGVRLQTLMRHILGLFHGQPGARQWRRILSESDDNRLEIARHYLESYDWSSSNTQSGQIA